MADSIRIKEMHSALFEILALLREIHLALGADVYSINRQDAESAPVANLGWRIHRICETLGLNFNDDASIKSIQQKQVISSGDNIPPGYYFGQFGFRLESDSQSGDETESNRQGRIGIVYEQRSNRFQQNNTGEIEVKPGDYVLCENIPQYLDELLDDLDKALNWQELGAFAVPSPDKKRLATFEGLQGAIAEITYMLSAISEQTSQTQIASLITQEIVREVFKAFGMPVKFKDLDLGANESGSVKIPYPALAPDYISLIQFMATLSSNISLLVGNSLKVQSLTDELETETPEVEPSNP